MTETIGSLSSSLRGKKILLVDDDADIVTSLRAAFEPTGAIISSTHNGNEAITFAEKDPPDLIILDLMLPGRSGFLVLEKLRARKKRNEKPFVIMITGNTGARHKMFAESMGVHDYFNKPVRLEKLIERASSLLATE